MAAKPLPAVVTVDFFTRRGCHLCDEALAVLQSLDANRVRIELHDVDTNEEWLELYGLLVPVTVFPGGEEMHYRVDPAAALRYLGLEREGV